MNRNDKIKKLRENIGSEVVVSYTNDFGTKMERKGYIVNIYFNSNDNPLGYKIRCLNRSAEPNLIRVPLSEIKRIRFI